jgi:uncharacterized membrane protein YvbJ
MAYCKKCGAKIKGTAEYCAPCQHDIDNDVSQAARKKNAKAMKAKK